MSRDDGTPIALVTGGTGALGREVVRELADRGFRVHVPYRSERSADDLRAFMGDDSERLVLARADLGDNLTGRKGSGVRPPGRLPPANAA